jgi:hypothetical protein
MFYAKKYKKTAIICLFSKTNISYVVSNEMVHLQKKNKQFKWSDFMQSDWLTISFYKLCIK